MKLKTLVGVCMALSVNFSSVAMASYGKVADNTVSAYRNSSLSQRTGNERVDRGDLVHVLEERDNAYYVRYPVKNGTKDRWVPKSIFNSSPTVKLNNGWYRIQPMHDLRRSMDAYGAQIGGGNNLHMWDSLDVDQQKFYLQNRGNGFFSLQSAASKLYVTANGSNGGANLYTSGWSGADTQQFCLLNAGGGSYYIICKAGDNLTFDCAGGGKANGTNVGLWWKDNDTTAWYKWKLTGVNVKQSTPTPTPTTQRGYINTQSLNLNLRRTPNGAIIGKLAKNTPVTILQGNSNGWTKVRTDSGQEGYVSSQYVAIGEPPKPIQPAPSNNLEGLINKWKGKKWDNRESSSIGSTCFGFANYIFRELHGVIAGSQLNWSNLYKLKSSSYGVSCLYSGYANETSWHNLLQKCKPGDFLQTTNGNNQKQHTMIFVSYNASTRTVRVLDANFASPPDNIIRDRSKDLSSFASRFKYVSVYTK